MAKIPVERKRRGLPWWAWLLLALAVIALLWLLVSLFDRDPDGAAILPGDARTSANAATADGTSATGSPPSTVAGGDAVSTPGGVPGVPAAGWAIVDPVVILDAPDRPALIGQRVQLEAVLVQSVTGDKTFWVGPNNDRQLFVFLEEQNTTAPTDAALNINPGQQVTLSGVVRALPPIAEARQLWSLTDENAARLENQQVYLRADRAEIVGGGTDAATQPAPPNAPAPPEQANAGAPSEPLFDMLAILNSPDSAALVGRPAVFQNVRVQRVAGDRAFWIGPSLGQQVLVVLDEAATPSTTIEGQPNINPGQDTTVFGEIRPFPGVAEAQQMWDVTNDELLAQQKVYVHAHRVDSLTR